MRPEQEDHPKTDDSDYIIQLYREYWKYLYSSAYRILKDKQACEDIIQDVFINIWNKRDQLQFNTSLKAYLAASVRYEVYRKIRQEKRFEPIAEEMGQFYSQCPTSDAVEYKEYLQEISRVVQELPEKCREVYMLSRDEQLSHKEISERLSISTKTVRNHLTRALRQLRPWLTELMVLVLTLLFR
jgi:RNA polymerase sigma-70 factor (ECF subfamily)